MTAIPIRVDADIFNDIYIPHLENMARTQIYYGGSAGGKSVFLAGRCVLDILGGGRNYLVCRAVKRYIRGSVFNEIEKVITTWGLEKEFKTNKTDMTITCRNGYQIIFGGLDDVNKLKSVTPVKGIVTDIWVEEATEVSKSDIKQLNKRLRGIELGNKAKPKRLILSFNPILKAHWIYKEYFSSAAWSDDQTEFDDGKISILKTWYIHNRFLSPEDIEDLEDESDPYYYQVYTLGNWGVLGNVIFAPLIRGKDGKQRGVWESMEFSQELIDSFDNIKNGLDFGFTPHPAAAVRLHYNKKKKEIYIFEELYELELTNDILAEKLKPMIGREYITCDSSEPKSIKELKNYEIKALGAVKGPDSVKHGIQWLRQHKIFIDKKCIKSKHEFEVYHYKEDKHGNIIETPVDEDNHLIDGIRYALENEMDKKRATFIKVKGL